MTGDDHGVATSDEQLVLQMAVADERALVGLHRRYAPHLTALARQMLPDPVEADACVQAAFVRAWETAAEFDPRKLSARTWLVTLSHRLFRNYVRDHAARDNVVRDYEREQTSAPKAVKDQELFLETNVAKNEAERENLSAPGRGVTAPYNLLRRAFFENHTDQALTELTGQPLEAIRQELRATLEQLGRAAERKP